MMTNQISEPTVSNIDKSLDVNVGDRSVNLFKQHSDSLQKKCGLELMNKWGWLSFISETKDIEKARNQQCHYDDFKEANDKQAWELFQAFLDGTNSILDYLQTNVEPCFQYGINLKK